MSWREYPSEDELLIGREWLARMSNILFCSAGEGLATNLVVSLHKDFADFSSFIDFLRRSSQPKLDKLHFFIVPLTRKDSIYKDFSFRTLTYENSGAHVYSCAKTKKRPEASINYKEKTIFILKKLNHEMTKFEQIVNGNKLRETIRQIISGYSS
ncbi:MAG: hypothetical protein KIH01_05720 [Candidatus Freyarchaeota archaeon]|nr:hypothetical protein [Candidatus Jordarchaeia archaeon]